MNNSPQYNQQKLKKYVFTKTWKAAVTASISENKNSGWHARKNPNQQCWKVVTFSDPSFSKKCIYFYTTISPNNTLNRPSSA